MLPQSNILWDVLTATCACGEFEGIASIDRKATNADKDAMIETCDLGKKKSSLNYSQVVRSACRVCAQIFDCKLTTDSH
jgi:hypothetical protein